MYEIVNFQTFHVCSILVRMLQMLHIISSELLWLLWLHTQVVLLDEASQMSEPLSLIPTARFGCHKLLLLGDPKVNYSILLIFLLNAKHNALV